MTHPHIILRIHRARLVEAKACEKGIALYDQIAALATARGDKRAAKRLRITWTPLHSVWLAVVHPSYARWLEEQGMIPPLRSASLYGAHLRGAYLYGADLRGASLVGADLVGTDLRGASLVGADLVGTDLRGADLRAAYRPTDPPDGWAPDASGYLRRVS